jgi:hypothetical protein
VSSLAGSTSSVVIAELLGNGTYEVRPAQQAMFHQGSVERVEQPLAPCGCPARQEPVLRTSTDQNTVVPAQDGKLQMAGADDPSGEKPGVAEANSPPASSDAKSDEAMAVMEAPLVFSGKEVAAARAAKAPPAPVLEASALPLSTRPVSPMPTTIVLPPRPHKGFFGHIKGFFGSIFR